MTGILTVTNDTKYQAIEITDHAGDRAVIARWMIGSGMIPMDDWTPAAAKQLGNELDQISGQYVVKHPSGVVTIMTSGQFAMEFKIEEILDELEQEFDLSVNIPEEIRKRGDFEITSEWEYGNGRGDWLHANDEKDARDGAAVFASETRHRTVVKATGPWE
jgi:hypothetical protein